MWNLRGMMSQRRLKSRDAKLVQRYEQLKARDKVESKRALHLFRELFESLPDQNQIDPQAWEEAATDGVNVPPSHLKSISEVVSQPSDELVNTHPGERKTPKLASDNFAVIISSDSRTVITKSTGALAIWTSDGRQADSWNAEIEGLIDFQLKEEAAGRATVLQVGDVIGWSWLDQLTVDGPIIQILKGGTIRTANLAYSAKRKGNVTRYHVNGKSGCKLVKVNP